MSDIITICIWTYTQSLHCDIGVMYCVGSACQFITKIIINNFWYLHTIIPFYTCICLKSLRNWWNTPVQLHECNWHIGAHRNVKLRSFAISRAVEHEKFLEIPKKVMTYYYLLRLKKQFIQNYHSNVCLLKFDLALDRFE